MFPLIVSSVMAGDPNPVNSFDLFNFWIDDATIALNVEWCERHVCWVKEMMVWADAPVWLVHQEAEAAQRMEAWNLLKSAREQAGTDWGVSILHYLREVIGKESYYQGVMPNPVPLTYFGR